MVLTPSARLVSKLAFLLNVLHGGATCCQTTDSSMMLAYDTVGCCQSVSKNNDCLWITFSPSALYWVMSMPVCLQLHNYHSDCILSVYLILKVFWSRLCNAGVLMVVMVGGLWQVSEPPCYSAQVPSSSTAASSGKLHHFTKLFELLVLSADVLLPLMQ